MTDLHRWELREEDQEFFARELADFVPACVFDAHAHLYRQSDWLDAPTWEAAGGPTEITLEAYRERMAWILPGREVHGLHFPYPLPPACPTDAPNAWVSEQMGRDRLARGQFLVRATDDPEWVRQEVRRLGLRGLKPFGWYANVPDYTQAELPDYLPEPLVRVAHEEGWSITVHLFRTLSAADPSNQHWIRHYCTNYPHMQLILDHSGRGFNPYLALKGLPDLAGLENLWIDTSVCCAPLATLACLRYIGPKRLLYGSDFYMSHQRGTNLGVNQAIVWLSDNDGAWRDAAQVRRVRPVLVGLENLRAVRAAFQLAGMGDAAVEDYFWNNAADLLGL